MKNKIMRVLPLIVVVAVLILIINNVHIQSVEEFYGSQTEEESEDAQDEDNNFEDGEYVEAESDGEESHEKFDTDEADVEQTESESQLGTVTLSITCTTVFDNWDSLDDALKEGYIPEDGVILEETSFSLYEGDTVFDILLRAVQQEGIQMEYQGMDANAFGTVYIEGINYLYEFSCGPLSGWMYTVNGETPDYGCSVYEPEDGDVIEWLYTCDLGNDIQGALKE